MIPNALPQLATGSHEAGSGKACIMNAISYLNGDTRITDMPDCAYPLLAKTAQSINDSLCTHRQGELLCRECSHQMWLLGARIIGTASAVDGWPDLDKRVLNVRLACWAAEQVLHLVRARDREVCAKAIEAARTWCAMPADAVDAANAVVAAAKADAANAADAVVDAYAAAKADAANAADADAAAKAAAYAAAYAADAAADAANAVVAADAANAVVAADAVDAAAKAAAYAANAVVAAAKAAAYDAAYAVVAAAYAAAYAVDAADAYAVAAAKVQLFHGLLDEFDRLTGRAHPKSWTDADYALVVAKANLPAPA
jgi:hypothetical protein